MGAALTQDSSLVPTPTPGSTRQLTTACISVPGEPKAPGIYQRLHLGAGNLTQTHTHLHIQIIKDSFKARKTKSITLGLSKKKKKNSMVHKL